MNLTLKRVNLYHARAHIYHICQIEERVLNFPDSTKKKKKRIYQKGHLEQLLNIIHSFSSNSNILKPFLIRQYSQSLGYYGVVARH